MDEENIEVQRSRWQRMRTSLGLNDPKSETFSTGGLAASIAEPSVRLLILPSDPEGRFIEFNEDFWTWWLTNHIDPANGRPDRWPQEFPTANAAVRHTGTAREMTGYLALHRGGGLELELGQGGAITAPEGRRYFRLSYMVGQIWSVFALYLEVIDRFSLLGPWEISCALRNTSGAVLSNFAEGWAEPGQGFFSENHLVAEPNLLGRRELHEWPGVDGVRDLAFSFGGWIEDAWEYRQRRFLAQRGSLMGQFDTTVYRSY